MKGGSWPTQHTFVGHEPVEPFRAESTQNQRTSSPSHFLLIALYSPSL